MRKLKPKKREIIPDPLYNSKVVTQLINQTMKKGKKMIAQKIVYEALKDLKLEKEEQPLDVFSKAINNIKPDVELRSRRVGGANYQVPFRVSLIRQQTLAIRWLLQSAQKRSGKSMIIKLKNEIMAAAKKEGGAMKKKQTIQKMAIANRAFAYYSW